MYPSLAVQIYKKKVLQGWLHPSPPNENFMCVCAHPVEPDRAEDVPQPSSYCHQRLSSCSGAPVSPRPNPQRSQLEGFQDGHEQGDILQWCLVVFLRLMAGYRKKPSQINSLNCWNNIVSHLKWHIAVLFLIPCLSCQYNWELYLLCICFHISFNGVFLLFINFESALLIRDYSFHIVSNLLKAFVVLNVL